MAGFIITKDGVSKTAGTVGPEARAAAARARALQRAQLEREAEAREARQGIDPTTLVGNGMGADGRQLAGVAAARTPTPTPTPTATHTTERQLSQGALVVRMPDVDRADEPSLLEMALLSRNQGAAVQPGGPAVQSTAPAPATTNNLPLLAILGYGLTLL